jgi:cytochrome c oxidase subunit 2
LEDFNVKGFFVLIAALLLAVSISGRAAYAHPPIDIVASNWKFTPGTITVHVGEQTTLHVTSSEGVHGIQSDELGIPQTTIVPGKFVDVTFTPKKAGTYVVHCSVICGAGHADMKLTITVES